MIILQHVYIIIINLIQSLLKGYWEYAKPGHLRALQSALLFLLHACNTSVFMSACTGCESWMSVERGLHVQSRVSQPHLVRVNSLAVMFECFMYLFLCHWLLPLASPRRKRAMQVTGRYVGTEGVAYPPWSCPADWMKMWREAANLWRGLQRMASLSNLQKASSFPIPTPI